MSKNKITGLCYGVSLFVFIIAVIIGSNIVTSHPHWFATPSLIVTSLTAFSSAVMLGIFGNFLKWLYPVFVAIFGLLFSVAVFYSDTVYLYLHHNHGVNDIRQAIEWTFFYALMAATFLGLGKGLLLKTIFDKKGK